MTTLVRQIAQVIVKASDRTVTCVVNTVFQAFLHITTGRALGHAYLDANRQVIETGLAIWLAEKTLQQVHLEVFLPDHSKAVERWDVHFTYGDGPGKEFKEPPVAELGRLCAQLRALPAGSQYRVVVRTAPGATAVPGWEATQLRPLVVSASQRLPDWAYGSITAGMTHVASHQ